MIKSKIILKGPLYGTKIIKRYKNPDILRSRILNKVCEFNNFTLSENESGYFVYFSFYTDDRKWSGRWFDSTVTVNDFNLDPELKQLTYIIPKWDGGDDYDEELTNVRHVVTFSDKGWKKVMRCNIFR